MSSSIKLFLVTSSTALLYSTTVLRFLKMLRLNRKLLHTFLSSVKRISFTNHTLATVSTIVTLLQSFNATCSKTQAGTLLTPPIKLKFLKVVLNHFWTIKQLWSTWLACLLQTLLFLMNLRLLLKSLILLLVLLTLLAESSSFPKTASLQLLHLFKLVQNSLELKLLLETIRHTILLPMRTLCVVFSYKHLTIKVFSMTSLLSSADWRNKRKLLKLLLLIYLLWLCQRLLVLWEQISQSVHHKDSVFPWDTVVQLLLSWLQKTNWRESCLVESLVFLRMHRVTQLLEWHYRPENNTSREKRQPLIFALLRHYLLTWLPCTAFIMDLRVFSRLLNVSMASHRCCTHFWKTLVWTSKEMLQNCLTLLLFLSLEKLTQS